MIQCNWLGTLEQIKAYWMLLDESANMASHLDAKFHLGKQVMSLLLNPYNTIYTYTTYTIPILPEDNIHFARSMNKFYMQSTAHMHLRYTCMSVYGS